jgi:hypothetical protein
MMVELEYSERKKKRELPMARPPAAEGRGMAGDLL